MHSAVVQKTVEIPQLQFSDLVGTDSAENSGIAAGAVPVVLWTPWSDSAEQLRSPTRSSTSLPLILSSTELNDDVEASLAHFSDSLRGDESRGARIFRALDDEEFFVIEGSPGWRGRRESDSQMTCRT